MEFVANFLALNTTPKYIKRLEIIESTDKQDQLLALTIRSPLVQNYPLPGGHVRQFLESIIRTCEAEHIQISDTVYEEISKCFLQPVEPESASHGAFIVENQTVVFAAPRSLAFVQNGSTGFVTWEAGKCLAWYMCTQQEAVSPKILELGCGTGVTGIIISKCRSVSEYVFTDYHENTLLQTRANCALNGIGDSLYRCELLDMLSDDPPSIETDIILGGDILYDEELCIGLVQLLSRDSSVFNETLIMSTIRTEETYTRFKSCLERCSDKLKYVVVKSQNFSKWIEEAEKSSSSWGSFLKTTSNSFDPIVELVSISKC